MRKRTTAMLLITAMLITACGSNSAPPGSTDTKGETPAKSGADQDTGTSAAAVLDPVTITIWYEGNDSRLPFFKAAEAEMQKEYPNYSINAVTFDNATLTTKALQAVTTNGGVDLIFNEASRLLVTHQQSNGGFEALDDVLAAAPNQEKVTDADKKVISANGQIIAFPINRSVNGLGYKTDVPGLEVTAEKVPDTFEKFVALGKEYQLAGIAGWTLHLGTSPDQIFNLFITGGNGQNDVWINSVPESQIQKNAKCFEQLIGLYSGPDAIWDKDAINEDFSAMYTKIQSGSVGMFRVGNWNAAGWDQPDSGVGEYEVTTWPSLDNSGKGGLFLGGVRGLAMPKNAPEKEAAKVFLSYCLSEAAQKASFDTMGSCMDYDVVDQNQLSKNQKIFFDSSIPIYPSDSYVGSFTYYPELLETYEKGLTGAYQAKDEAEIKAAVEKLHEDLNRVIEQNK
ncbi:ABC transporter substrate-binding protein [Lacrimispora indolis]|uniref:ABC transporter substrate-binding protein n=1 Tax=Lacrimispora indolis TaxID=69825 RepID=UPI0004213411|nr:extracellular solute-binding protein [[Clostridium] methoxybenzovorans]